jgi:hypothetical protein
MRNTFRYLAAIAILVVIVGLKPYIGWAGSTIGTGVWAFFVAHTLY